MATNRTPAPRTPRLDRFEIKSAICLDLDRRGKITPTTPDLEAKALEVACGKLEEGSAIIAAFIDGKEYAARWAKEYLERLKTGEP